MDDKITIGITGGIGSGKTYVCQALKTMGYPVFYSDQVAKDILISDNEIISKIKSCFGPNAYRNNELNKDFVATQIFKNSELRESINKIVHPVVRMRFKSWAINQSQNIVFNEAAILFETDSYKSFNYTILIVADHQTKINRLKLRDQLSEVAIQKRFGTQWSDERKIPLANFVIDNNETNLLLPQLIRVIEKIKDEQKHL